LTRYISAFTLFMKLKREIVGMMLRIFVTLVVLAAIAAGILTVTWHEQVVRIVVFRDFFDVALPILGFGALIKYLCTCSCGNCCHKE
jgi:hypothetical protein